MKYAIIVPTYNNCENLLKPAIESIIRNTTKNNEIDAHLIIVANGCTDGTALYLKDLGVKKDDTPFTLHIIWDDKPLGYTVAVNKGIKKAVQLKSNYTILMNNDVVLMDGAANNNWLNILTKPFKNSRVGMVGTSKIIDDTTKATFIIFYMAIIKTAIFSEIGLLDEVFNPGYGEDIDFAIRLQRAGYDLIRVPVEGVGYDYTETFPLYHGAEKTMHDDKSNIKGVFGLSWEEIVSRNKQILAKKYTHNVTPTEEILPHTFSNIKIVIENESLNKKVEPKLTAPTPIRSHKVSIIIPTYNNCDNLLKPCIESIVANTELSDIEVIIVANGCTDNTREYCKTLDEKIFKLLWFDEQIGFIRATNNGILEAETDFIILLNNDNTILPNIVKSDWIRMLINPLIENKNVGITGPLRIPCRYAGYDFLSFFCVCIRKDVIQKVGLLDDSFGLGFGDDVDYSARIQIAGYQMMQVPTEGSAHQFPIHHKYHQTFGKLDGSADLLTKNRVKLAIKYRKEMKLNLGCGDKLMDGYINIDKYNANADLMMDITDTHLIPDNTIDEIIAIQVFEHLNPFNLSTVLSGWRRILKPNGKLILEMPNILEICKNFEDSDKTKRYEFLNCIYGTTMIDHPHLFGWYPDTLNDILSANGFTNNMFSDAQFYHWGINFRSTSIKNDNDSPRTEQPIKPDLPDGWFSDHDITDYRALVSQIPNNGTMLEIGTWKGRSLCSVADIIIEKNISVYTIDTYLGTTSTEYEKNLHAEAKTVDLAKIFSTNIEKFGLVGRVKILVGESRTFPVQFQNKFFDLIFVDADHTYESVKEDIINWYPKVKAHGILSGHDVQWQGVHDAISEKFNYHFKWNEPNGNVWWIKKPKVYDAFSFFNELDLLDLRLNELNDVVDVFVLSEANQTHSGLSKPLYYVDNKSRFEKFNHKIIHLVAPNIDTPDPWVREHAQRDYLKNGWIGTQDDDIIIISDIDEIPNPNTIKYFYNNDKINRLPMFLSYYYVNNRLTPGTWDEAKISAYKVIKNMTPTDVRYASIYMLNHNESFDKVATLSTDIGWHFSFLGGAYKIQEKIKSFAHQEHNNTEILNEEHINDVLATGKDLFNRGYNHELVEIDDTFPKHILQNKKFFTDISFIKETSDIKHKKVYDCFLFYNELDMLELRLNELNDVVDKFVLVESDITFTGKPKLFYYNENKERFSKFADKIIHIMIDDTPRMPSPWDVENYQRDMIYSGLKMCSDDDIVLISDVDEIPNPNVIRNYNANNGISMLKQRMAFYYFNCVSGAEWWNAKIGKWSDMRRHTATSIRQNNCVYEIIDGGWHFTAMGGVDAILNKLNAFSHTEYNTEHFRDENLLKDKIKNGVDVYERGLNAAYIEIDETFPKYIRDNKAFYTQNNYIFDTNNALVSEQELRELNEVLYDEIITQNGYEMFKEEIENTSFIDIGANYGYVSILAARLGAKKVLSFEPNHKNYEILRRLTRGFEQIIPYEKAVFTEVGPIKISDEGIESNIFDFHQKNKMTEVPSVSLESLFSGFNEEEQVTLKLDCEGAEYDIIYNTPIEILQKIRFIYLEIHVDANPKYIKGKDDLLKYLSDQGFECKQTPFQCGFWYPDGTFVPSDNGIYKCKNTNPVYVSPIKLNIGCEDNLLEGYINCDAKNMSADMMFDYNAIPFPDKSVKEIRLNISYNQEIIDECYRALTLGGKLYYVTESSEVMLSNRGVPIEEYIKQLEGHTHDEIYPMNTYGMTAEDLHDKTIVDVGANYGFFSFRALELGAKSSYCFEPVKENYNKLNELTHKNNSIHTFNTAILDGTVSVVKMKVANVCSDIWGGEDGEEAECVSLMEAMSHIIESDRDSLVLKLDCEGSEFEILLKSPAYLIQKFDSIYIEVHDQLNPNFMGKSDMLLAYLKSLGFEIVFIGPQSGWWLKDGSFRPDPIQTLHLKNRGVTVKPLRTESSSNEKVVIIVPAYNSDFMIENTLNSIISQTFQNWVLIITNDGSTDNTQSIIDKFKETDSRIYSVSHETNKGVSHAFNTCIDWVFEHQPEFNFTHVAICSSNDIWYPNHLEESLKQFNLTTIDVPDMVYSNMFSESIDGYPLMAFGVEFDNEPIYANFIRGNFILAPTVVMTYECLATVGYYNTRLDSIEDWDYWTRVAEAGFKIRRINETFSKYILTHNGLGGKRTPEQVELFHTKHANKNTRIFVLSPCFNEDKLLPFYLDYYTNFVGADKIILYDGGSTDKTIEIASQYPNVEVVSRQDDTLNDQDLLDIRNNGWKAYRNECDWMIICDIDEFLYHPNIRRKLVEYKNNGITIPDVTGYNMISDSFPEFVKGQYLPDIVQKGNQVSLYDETGNNVWGIWDEHGDFTRMDGLNKHIVFNPQLVDINYGMGCHICYPTGIVEYSKDCTLKMLHFNMISHEYWTNKSKNAAQRLSDFNIEKNLGCHYEQQALVSEEDFIKVYNSTKQII